MTAKRKEAAQIAAPRQMRKRTNREAAAAADLARWEAPEPQAEVSPDLPARFDHLVATSKLTYCETDLEWEASRDTIAEKDRDAW